MFAGGFAGALCRVALADALVRDPSQWPWATFVANIAGTLVLGYVATLLRDRHPLRLRLLGTGFCGALTTFSALQLELLEMLDGDHLGLAAAYALVSVAAGVAAVVAGSRVARRGRRPA
jgi:CrcB protein